MAAPSCPVLHASPAVGWGPLALCLWLALALSSLLSQSATPIVTLEWDRSPDRGVAEYILYYGLRSEVYAESILAEGRTAVTLEGLRPGRRYFFAVSAVNFAGMESELSEEVDIWLVPPCPVPTAALDVTPANAPAPGEGQDLTLTLRATEDTRYEVFASDNGGDTWRSIWFTPLTSASRPVTFLDPGVANPDRRSYQTEFRGQYALSTRPLSVTQLNSPSPGRRVEFDGLFGRLYAVQASDDGAVWETLLLSPSLANNTHLQILDAGVSSASIRLYRLLEAPDPSGPYWNACGPAQNLPPSLSSVPRQQTTLDQPTAPVTIRLSDPDTPPARWTLTVDSSEPSVIPVSGVVITGNGTERLLVVRPARGRSGVSVVTLTLSDGENTRTTSFEVEVAPFRSGTAPLVVRREGTGSVSPDLDGQTLEIGRSYTLRATPGAGQLFAGWSGGATSSLPELTFQMRAGLVLTASFGADPVASLEGDYNGVVSAAASRVPGQAAAIRLTTSARGKYSGVLTLDGRRYSFSGQAEPGGTHSVQVARPGSSPLTLTFKFGASGGDPTQGQLTDGSWIAAWKAHRSGYNARTNPAPMQGRYTLVLSGQSNPARGPEGSGLGTVRVDAGGNVTFAGTLADGTRIAQRVPLARNGVWPLYVSLLGGRGSISGGLVLTNGTGRDITGTSSWTRRGVAGLKYYSDGFTNDLQVQGSLYHPPASATNRVLALSDARLRFAGGNLGPGFSHEFSLLERNRILNRQTNKLSMAFSPSSGLFSGRVTSPFTGKPIVFRGAVLQSQNTGAGFALGTNRSARVTLGP